MISWVIGSSGLLGSAVLEEVKKHSHPWQPARKIFWDNTGSSDSNQKSEESIKDAAKHFLSAADGRAWEIYWCAGIGVVGSDAEVLEREVKAIKFLLSCLINDAPKTINNRKFFFASSAGGVYAGSSNPPFTEASVPVPISDYGVQKLEIEALLKNVGATSGIQVCIGRIANIYGTNQNIKKQQGIVTTLVKATVLNTTVNMFVPLNTIRNYIYSTDAAYKIVNYVRDASLGYQLRIICSEQNWSLGSLLRITKDVAKKRIHLAHSLRKETMLQPLDLRMKSLSQCDELFNQEVSLPVGVSMVREHLLRTNQNGQL